MLHQTKGIVLNKIRYGDASFVVHVYTEKFGKQSYMIKGGQLKTSKTKSGLFQPFFVLDLEVYYRERKNIQSLKEANLLQDVASLSFDAQKNCIALFLCEVLTKVLRGEEANQDLFDFLYHSICYLNLTNEPLPLFHLCFLLKLTRFLGFQPRANRSEEKLWFDMDNGCFISKTQLHKHCLGEEASKCLHDLLTCSIHELHNLNFEPGRRKSILRGILNFFALHNQGFTLLKSLCVIEEIFD